MVSIDVSSEAGTGAGRLEELYRSLRHLREPAAFAAYLRRAVVNACTSQRSDVLPCATWGDRAGGLACASCGRT